MSITSNSNIGEATLCWFKHHCGKTLYWQSISIKSHCWGSCLNTTYHHKVHGSARFHSFSSDYNFFVAMQDHFQLANKYPCLLSTDTKDKNGNHSSSARLKEISKTRNLYITGHQDGAINFWDASCPFLLPLLSMKPQVNFTVVIINFQLIK